MHPRPHLVGTDPIQGLATSALFLSVISTAGFMFPGCASPDSSRSTESPSFSAPLMVTVRPAGDATSHPEVVALAAGGRLNLELPVTTGTGFLWELTLDPIGILGGDLVGTTVRRDGAMPGAVTEQRWELTATAVGRATIEAVYRRPWEGDVEPARRFSVEVEVVAASIPSPKS